MWLTFLVQPYVASKNESVSSENPFGIGIPYNQLLVWIFHRVKLVDVNSKSASATRVAESLLAKTSYLQHDVRGVKMIDNVDFVAAFVCVPKLL